MFVKDAMSKPAITVAAEAPLSDAIALLVGYKMSGLPVVDASGALCGVLSEGDLLRRIEMGTAARPKHWWSSVFSRHSAVEAYRMTEGRRVSDVMSGPAITVGDEDDLSRAADLMEKFGVKRMPVVHDGKLVGMLTRADFVKVLRTFLAPAYEEPAVSDVEIGHRFLAEVGRQTWAGDCSIQIGVANGHVTLTGAVHRDGQREALRVAAENLLGVQEVVNDIEVVDPVIVPGF